MESPSLVILLLTDNYFCSTFCQCELGATWAMNLPCIFPIVVPPQDKAKLKATLMVTQAGDVTDPSYLDELLEAVKKYHGVPGNTPRWNVKKALFLKDLPAILAKLAKPAVVSADKLTEVQKNFDEALKELQANEEKFKTLNEQIAELKKCKDAAQVKAVTAKFSSSDKEFGRLQQEAQKALKKLERATRIALFWKMRGERYFPKGDEEWDDVETAKAENEVDIYGGEDACTVLNDEHPRVTAADVALDELNAFLKDKKHADFIGELTEERQFPITLSNKEFWRNFLVNV